MRILVAIANYGMKNCEFANQVINEYRSMPFDVDIFILSEAPKNYGDDVKVLVGLPSKDPWTLPFAHKELFAKNIDNYDVFIYTEDDVLIKKENIVAYLKATEIIGGSLLPGFIRYEVYPNGKKNYPDIFGPHHWISGSVAKFSDYVYAKLSNDHSACYILTKRQLLDAIASGGFLVSPHSGRYDLICSAGNDPYTQCGFDRVICLSHLHEFEVHHISNAYLNRLGVDEAQYQLQITALFEIYAKNISNKELFPTIKTLDTSWWDKDYYESCREDIIRLIPSEAKEILSVGCGCGMTEEHLINNGKNVVAIPLDSVIGKIAESKGINVCVPDFDQAFETFGDKRFDAIILSEVVQHLPNPIDILSKLGVLLKDDGLLVGSVPNLGFIRRLSRRLFAKNRKTSLINSSFNNTTLNLTSESTIKRWFAASGLKPIVFKYVNYESAHPLSVLAPNLPGVITASSIVFSAKRTDKLL